MAAATQRPKLVVIVGPTASGKSELAMNLAKLLDGEIIAADSRTIYRGMDVGTAKPTKLERRKIPHFGLDLVSPGQPFSARKFKDYTTGKIGDIQKRGKLPILVGGTGLYIDSVIFDFGFLPAPADDFRKKLEAMSAPELQYIIQESGYKMPSNSANKRHLIRVIESAGQVASRRAEPLPGSLIIGLKPRDWVLKRRIKQRATANFGMLLKETKSLLKRYGETKLRASAGLPYLVILDYLAGQLGSKEALQKIQTAEWQYARRQKTWFKRNPYIIWYSGPKRAFEAVKSRVD